MLMSYKKRMFSIFFDRNEGSLVNARKHFIREYDFLISEGLMDGVQSGTTMSFFEYEIFVRSSDSSAGHSDPDSSSSRTTISNHVVAL